MIVHDVHGVRVGVEGEAAALAEGLLSRHLGGEDGPPDLRLTLERSDRRFSGEGRDVPLMFQGPLRVLGRDDTIVVTDGASWLEIGESGRRVRAGLHRASLEDPRALESGLLVVGIVLALRWHHRFHLHAAAVTGPAGGILLPGSAGAGKSTLTLALLRRGHDYLTDDAVLLALDGGAVRMSAFLRPFHLADASARAFPAETVALAPGRLASGKRELDPRRAFPGRDRRQLEAPRVVLFPRVTGRAVTTVAPLPPADALGALIESSAILAVDRMPNVAGHLAALRGLVAGATCFRAELGRDLLEHPDATLSRLLADLSVAW